MLKTYTRIEAFYQEYIVGKRTYIIAAIAAVVNLLNAYGVVTLSSQQLDTINVLLGSGGLGTLRAAVKK
jgi:hypothetical protein